MALVVWAASVVEGAGGEEGREGGREGGRESLN